MATSVPGRAHAAAPNARIVVPLVVGAAVAVAVGVYADVHTPSGRALTTLGFSSLLTMKVWLTSAAAVLALVQLATALRMYGRIGSGPAARWVALLHRTSGVVAVLLTVPVAFHCVWSLGFDTFDTRTTVHSLLGCAFYGVFVAKMLSLKMRGMPAWALPVLGGLVFVIVIAIWVSSSLWYFRTSGVGY